MNSLFLQNVTVTYHEKPMLFDITTSVPMGVLCGIVGPNGAGKTTLLKAVVDLIRPRTGLIRVFDQPFAAVRSRVAYVPQRTLIDWDFPITVFDVVMMGRYPHIGWCRRPSAVDIAKVWQALEVINMVEYAKVPIGELSGGQQQRIFIARALTQEADLYLMDEPFAGVDRVTEHIIVEILHQLRSRGKTAIIVHHDLYTVRTYFDWLVLVHCTLIASGRTDEVYVAPHLEKTYGRSLERICYF